MEIETAFYNYYNIKDRYSPETPQMPAWKRDREVTIDKIKATNNDPNLAIYKRAEKLEERYYAASVSNRSRYSTREQAEDAIWKKYMSEESKYYGVYSKEQRHAMYDNEVYMTLFGCLSGGGHPFDPFGGEDVSNDENSYAEQKSYNRKMVTTQINNIFKSNGLTNQIGNQLLTFHINPLIYRLSVEGTEDKDLIENIENVLNQDRNSIELFFHIMRNSSSSISQDMKNKYLLTSEFYDMTGQNLNEYIQKKDGFYNKDGKNALDVFQEYLSKSNSKHKGANYDYFKDLIERVSYKNIATIPDLGLSIGYQNGVLMDMPIADEYSKLDLKA